MVHTSAPLTGMSSLEYISGSWKDHGSNHLRHVPNTMYTYTYGGGAMRIPMYSPYRYIQRYCALASACMPPCSHGSYTPSIFWRYGGIDQLPDVTSTHHLLVPWSCTRYPPCTHCGQRCTHCGTGSYTSTTLWCIHQRGVWSCCCVSLPHHLMYVISG